MVAGLTADDLVLCLVSGGGSALLTLPAPGLTLADKQSVNKALLKSGAAIGEMNCVRKHLSAIKGGRLAVAASPARVATRLISDVPNDDPSVIGSGPTVQVGGTGRGGRNAEFLLALGVALDGLPGVHVLAADTDGIDGTEDNAGAVIGPDTLARAARRGLSAKALLADNDGYSFFSGLDDLVVTGPTLTNVNDFRAILVERHDATGDP